MKQFVIFIPVLCVLLLFGCSTKTIVVEPTQSRTNTESSQPQTQPTISDSRPEDLRKICEEVIKQEGSLKDAYATYFIDGEFQITEIKNLSEAESSTLQTLIDALKDINYATTDIYEGSDPGLGLEGYGNQTYQNLFDLEILMAKIVERAF